jgi:hypothetical protein
MLTIKTPARIITVSLCGAGIQITIGEEEVAKLRVIGFKQNWWITSHRRNVSGPFFLRKDAMDAITTIQESYNAA